MADPACGGRRHQKPLALARRYGDPREQAVIELRITRKPDPDQQRPCAGLGKGHDFLDGAVEGRAARRHLDPEALSGLQPDRQRFPHRHLDPQRGGIVNPQKRPAGRCHLARLSQTINDDARHGRADFGIGKRRLGRIQRPFQTIDIRLCAGKLRGRLIEALAGDDIAFKQLFDAVQLASGQIETGLRRGQRLACLGGPRQRLLPVEHDQCLIGLHGIARRYPHLFDPCHDLR